MEDLIMYTIAITDDKWVNNLKSLAISSETEVNFWTPTPWNVKLQPNSNFYFLLKSPIREVCGKAKFLRYENKKELDAWNEFGQRNGMNSFEEMQYQLSEFRKKRSEKEYSVIGCIILDNVELWEDYIDLTDYGLSFPRQVVKYKNFDGESISIQINELDADIKEINQNKSIPETEKKVFIDARIGQGKYKRDLEELWKGCSVTGYLNLNFLIASHIKPWKDSNNNERLDKYNGLLLCPNLDKLFDSGHISFQNNGKIILSKLLDNDDLNSLGIHENMSINIKKENLKYLNFHREKIFKN